MVRVKSRYLLCEINVTERKSLLQLDDRAVAAAVREAVARIHGDYGEALCSIRFSVRYLNAHTGIVFLRFSKRYFKLLWSALPFLSCVKTRGQTIPCFLKCLHVGGTIRTCQKFLIKYNSQQLHRMLPECQTKEEKEHVHKAIMRCSQAWGRKKEDEDEVGDEDDDDDDDDDDDGVRSEEDEEE